MNDHNEHEPHDSNSNGTESGVYRKLKSILFPATVGLLWVLLAWMAGTIYADLRKVQNDVTTLQAQRQADVDAREEMRSVLRMVQSDCHELLKEVRK